MLFFSVVSGIACLSPNSRLFIGARGLKMRASPVRYDNQLLGLFLFSLFTTIKEVFGRPLDMTATERDHYGEMIELLGTQKPLLHLSWATNSRHVMVGTRQKPSCMTDTKRRMQSPSNCRIVSLFCFSAPFKAFTMPKSESLVFWRENLEGSCQADLELLRMLWCYDITSSHGV